MREPLLMTVAYVMDGERILLGMKKVRRGKGWWNGFGGHVEKNEPIIIAAIRELIEETDGGCGGIIPLAIKEVGVILIKHTHKKEKLELHYFLVDDFYGQAENTDEMTPRWFDAKKSIPYQKMWPSDKIILPIFLRGEICQGEILYDRQKNIMSKNIQIVKSLRNKKT